MHKNKMHHCNRDHQIRTSNWDQSRRPDCIKQSRQDSSSWSQCANYEEITPLVTCRVHTRSINVFINWVNPEQDMYPRYQVQLLQQDKNKQLGLKIRWVVSNTTHSLWTLQALHQRSRQGSTLQSTWVQESYPKTTENPNNPNSIPTLQEGWW